jgi:hypothetical protein
MIESGGVRVCVYMAYFEIIDITPTSGFTDLRFHMQWTGCIAGERLCVVYFACNFIIIAVGDDTDGIKVSIQLEFYIWRKEIINYSRIHISLYRLLYFYYFMLRRNLTRLTSENLPKSSVSIRELYKPTY